MMQLARALRADLEWIVGERHHQSSPAHHAVVGARIEAALEALGFVVQRQSFYNDGVQGANVIAELPGGERADEIVLLGAHYDTVIGSPGADDNGSAVAGLLACARALAGGSYARTLRLAAFDMEETQPGGAGLVGSHCYAESCRGEKLAAMLDFEMIGCCRGEPGSQQMPAGYERLFPETAGLLEARGRRGDFLAVVADERSRALLERFCAAAGELPVLPLIAPDALEHAPDLLRSDHTPFWGIGVPALMLTDTANFRNPHYHGPGDTLETLDIDFTARVVQATLRALRGLLDGEQQGEL